MAETPKNPPDDLKPIPMWLAFSFVFWPLAFVGLVVHELAHGLTAHALGGEFLALWVFPGIELWPDFGAPYDGTFTYFGLVRYLSGPGWADTERGWATLMGSGSTFVVGVVALIALLSIRPRNRWLRYLLISLALWYLDMLTYTVFPQLGLPHWIIVGGRTPEPVIGAERLGVDRTLFTVAVVFVCAGMSAALWRYLRHLSSANNDN